MSTDVHVSVAGSDRSTGEAADPLRTIGRAAELAQPGDRVIVHAGDYREWVRPPRGGTSDLRRITYTAAEGERVVIKGSEPVTGWIPDGGGVWHADVANSIFGEFNPFAIALEGDWLVRPIGTEPRKHLGAVYIDGRRLDEAKSRQAVAAPRAHDSVVDDWTGVTVPIEDPAWTERNWFAEVEEETTVIWANFGEADPADALVEINVRPSTFMPVHHHIDYVTVRGFEMAQAATQWAPPTAEQPGAVGPNWAKGWIIEDNVIHDSMCVGISLGKERSSGHNFATIRRDKPGYQYQLESVFSARQIGWDREHIGSHIVRRNTIFDCGQAGIVGHLGCVFSVIEDNHIHHIAVRRQFYGHEIAGIKLHAAIDVVIRHNRIHDCSLAIWLDWEAQGTRVTRNVCHNNCRDLFVEVSHGPYVVDDNVFASLASIEVVSEGGAFVHNLVGGTVRLEPVMDRATPYHRPHSTQVVGFSVIPGGDDRWVGNLFFGGNPDLAYAPGSFHHGAARYGTIGYAGYPASFESYLARTGALEGDHQRFYGQKLPVDIRHNVYVGGAQPYDHEDDAVVLAGEASVRVSENEEGVALLVELPDGIDSTSSLSVSGSDLGHAYFPDAAFENPDGSPVEFLTDITGERVVDGQTRPAGPVSGLRSGTTRVPVVRC